MVFNSYNRRLGEGIYNLLCTRGQFGKTPIFTKGNPPLPNLYYRNNAPKTYPMHLLLVVSILLFMNNPYKSNKHLRNSIFLKREFLNVLSSHRESKIKMISNFDVLAFVAPRFTSISNIFHFQWFTYVMLT